MVVFFTAVLYFYYKYKLETAIFAALVSGIITSYWAVNKQWLDQDQAFKDLFREFNKRFDDMNESLNEILNGEADTRTQEKIIQDYLNLCSEEYLWYKKGRIDKDVWQAWKGGIDYYLKNETFRNHFKKESSHNDSYYGLFNVLKLT